jgi:hypothetical protein
VEARSVRGHLEISRCDSFRPNNGYGTTIHDAEIYVVRLPSGLVSTPRINYPNKYHPTEVTYIIQNTRKNARATVKHPRTRHTDRQSPSPSAAIFTKNHVTRNFGLTLPIGIADVSLYNFPVPANGIIVHVRSSSVYQRIALLQIWEKRYSLDS